MESIHVFPIQATILRLNIEDETKTQSLNHQETKEDHIDNNQGIINSHRNSQSNINTINPVYRFMTRHKIQPQTIYI